LLCACAAPPPEGRYPVRRGNFNQSVILSGHLKAERSEEFVAPVTDDWQIQIKWMKKEGEAVRPGDIVVRFDTANLSADIEKNIQDLQLKSEQIAQKKADMEFQRKDLDMKIQQAEIDCRKKEIDAAVPVELQTRFEYDRNQLELKKSRYELEKVRREKELKFADLQTQYHTLEIERDEIRSALEKNRGKLQSLELAAHTAGIVLYGNDPNQERKLQVGDTVFSTTCVATIPDSRSLLVEAWAGENDIRWIRRGRPVTVIPDAYPHQRFNGVVRDIMNNGEQKNNWGKANYFRLDIALLDPDERIMKPGMSVRCLTAVAGGRDVLLVPLAAALFHEGSFWVRPVGGRPLRLHPLGSNAFDIAVAPDGQTGLRDGAEVEAPTEAEVARAAARKTP